MRSARVVGVAKPVACCGKVSCESSRGLVAQSRVRALLVVVDDPFRDLCPCMREAKEKRLVEKLIAHAPVEALAESILHRLAGRDEMPK